jgi:hypothetical protein
MSFLEKINDSIVKNKICIFKNLLENKPIIDQKILVTLIEWERFDMLKFALTIIKPLGPSDVKLWQEGAIKYIIDKYFLHFNFDPNIIKGFKMLFIHQDMYIEDKLLYDIFTRNLKYITSTTYLYYHGFDFGGLLANRDRITCKNENLTIYRRADAHRSYNPKFASVGCCYWRPFCLLMYIHSHGKV